ncbi:MAG: hypothetical protein GC159_12760 [Phycisphaera sp.]|nr:hypothetical protein [Phycisphaera sp.]
MNRLVYVVVILMSACAAHAGELRFAGVLGNSGGEDDTRAAFAGKPATGMGPVLDRFNTLWERGGTTRLNRYALDGRLLASFELPNEAHRLHDQLTLADDTLLMLIGKAIYRLPVTAERDAQIERLNGNVETLAAGSVNGKAVIHDGGQLMWLDPKSGERTLIAKGVDSIYSLVVDVDGTIYAFGNNQVNAWRDGAAVAGYPRPFNGGRPQKIGDYWYSFAYHGTIFRFNAQFEPDPGVVAGGASGSFIGYLPQSVDIGHGAGLVHVRDNLFAVSGFEGVVQLLEWKNDESRMEVVRRIGPLVGLGALALDAEGNVWTPRGSLRWTASPETPFTLGDVEPYYTTQPVVLNGKTICFIKKHYSYTQKVRGDAIDESGWAHLEARGVEGVTLNETTYGSAALTNAKGQHRLIVTEPNGKAMDFSLGTNGDIGDNPRSVTIPGLEKCTSLAWFGGRLLAADRGSIVAYREVDDGWKEDKRLTGFGKGVFIQGDGKRLVVSDPEKGRVQLFESLENDAVIGTYDGLASPTIAAVSGDRVVVYEEGKQRLVKLTFDSGGTPQPSAEQKVHHVKASVVSGITESDYYSIGHPGGIPVAVAVTNKGVALRVPEASSSVTLGVANDRDAYIVDGASLQLPEGDWSHLRVAAFVRLGTQQERLGFNDHRPIHAPFSDSPADWAAFDMRNYHEVVAERKEQIRIDFTQPSDGKATIVIENAAGERVRNLVSGRAFNAGRNTVVWDGFDENGQLVPPGDYHWRGVTHPGIKPDFRMSFAGGREPINARPWGPNHGLLQDAVADSKHIYFAAPVTEGGWALLALDPEGNFVQGYEHQQGFGIGHNAIAVDDKYLYCAQDGFGWGGSRDIDWKRDDWKSHWTLTVARYDLNTGKVVEFPGKLRAFEADVMEVGPGSAHPDLHSYNLGGLAVSEGKLYVGSRGKNAVLVFDAATGKQLDKIALRGVRHLASLNDVIYAATDDGVVRVKDGKRIVDANGMDLAGITVAPNGDLYVSDDASHQVQHFTADGKHVETIGKPGGPYKGRYDADRMVNPAGLAIGPNGKLWVTEKRWNPKRVMAWDLSKKTVVYEKFGIPHYGGDGSGFDPQNPRRWIGLGCFWDIDIDKGTARPTHVMALSDAHFEHYYPQGYSVFREAGRTFLCARGKIALICEVFDDGSIREIAAACGTHHFAYGCEWDPPQAYIDAFYEKWPEKRKDEKAGRGGEGKPWAGRVGGVLWVDRNGDGQPQKDEFTFTDEGVKFADGAWGHRQDSLTLRFPVAVGKQVKIVEIKPKGFLANGIPDYPSLQDAVNNNATDIDLTEGYKREGVSTARDRFGRFIFNSSPEMNAYDAHGKRVWTYPNHWSDVHGSHDAPLPETGVMQGTMAIIGMAPFDDKADVFFLNGNHGRCFMLTSDGLYLDEAFTDVRVSYLMNEYRLGGEIFGGMFERSATDGRYYVQIGHGPYRIYELHGIDQAKRMDGSIRVTNEQIAAAERSKLRRIADKQPAKTLRLPGELAWDQSGRFKVVLDAAVEGDNLHLTYQVQDPSPWINNGRDWTTLFATGDTVDIQIGVNPDADAKRRGPVEGDQRLLIAPFEGQPIAVLYQHRKPNAKNPIQFTSPWRGETVDNVERLTGAAIQVKTNNQGYVVDAKIPLAAIGLKPSSKPLRTDFGVTFGNAEGTDTQLRSYWANRATMLVDDIPGEIMLHPNLWGAVQFESSK